MTFLFFGILGVMSSKLSFVMFIVLFYFFLLFKYNSELMFFVGGLMDKFSFLLILLVIWMSFIMICCVFKYKWIYSNMSYGQVFWGIMVLMIFLMFSFLLENLLGFYIFFEISLIPLLWIILGWGYQVERVSASFYLLIYTLFGSFPLLLVFLLVSNFEKSLVWWYMQENFIGLASFYVFFLCVFVFTLMIKLPMYLLHLWLPKAHVEAPAIGSMILAAVLLKLSAYAFYRVLPLVKQFFNSYKEIIISMLLLGAVISAIVCLMQADLKSLIAYSSISHMGGMMAGLLVQNIFAMQGAWVIILGHGFCSSALFFFTGFQYEQNLSRQLLLVRGQGNYFYFFILFWILFLFINFSLPPFLNLVGELEVVFTFFSLSWKYFLFFGLLLFFVASYCVYCFSVLVHGMGSFMKVLSGDMDLVYMVSIFHFFPLFGLVMKLDFLV